MMLEKYLELSKIAQQLEIENKTLVDSLIKINDQCFELEETIKQKDQLIGDLIIEKSRLKDLLLLNHESLEHAKAVYKIPQEKSSFFDKIFGVTNENNNSK